MGQNIRELILKGQQAINKYQLEGKKVPSDWNGHLNKLINEYKINTVRRLLDEINEIYPVGLFAWLNENNKSLYKVNIEIEDKLNDFLNDNNVDISKFEIEVKHLKEWYSEAISVFKDNKESNQTFINAPVIGVNLKKGGQEDMGFAIEAVKTPEPGVYDVTIADVKVIDGKYGERLQVEFELEDDRKVNGFFPKPATSNNKTGQLFKKALGEIRNADSDELIGKIVKILVEEKQVDGRTYTNVTKVM